MGCHEGFVNLRGIKGSELYFCLSSKFCDCHQVTWSFQAPFPFRLMLIPLFCAHLIEIISFNEP